ncbi:WD40 repeat domain-containing protein [archaeon]|nr:WD40 repeat domain-containing protein [archaeon]
MILQHDRPVNYVGWSADSRRLITGADNGVSQLWDAYAKKVLLKLENREGGVVSSALSPDGAFVAAASGNVVSLYNSSSGVLLSRLASSNNASALSLSWFPFSSLGFAGILVGKSDGTVSLWVSYNTFNASSWYVAATLVGHNGSVDSVTWSPDGYLFAAASSDGVIRIWTTRSIPYNASNLILNSSFSSLTGHTPGLLIKAVSWSKDGTRIASASADGTVRIWDVTLSRTYVPRSVLLKIISGHRGGIRAVDWSPDGYFVVSGGDDGLIKIWRASRGTLLSTFTGHQSAISSVSWSLDGKLIASASADNSVRLWKAPSSSGLVKVLAGGLQVHSVSWSPDGSMLASGIGQEVRVWNVSNSFSPSTVGFQRATAKTVAWSWDGRKLASGADHSADPTLRVWDVFNRTLVVGTAPREVYSVSWSADNQKIVTGSPTGYIWIWNSTSASLLFSWIWRPYSAVVSVAWSPNGSKVAAASTYFDDSVSIWNASSAGRRLTRRGDLKSAANFVSWSPDSSKLASAHGDGSIAIWSVSNSSFVLTQLLHGHASSVLSVAWNPDSTKLVSASEDKTIRVWNVSSGSLIEVLGGHTSRVFSVSWSPDGRKIASGSGDGTIRIWSVAS